MDRDFAQALSAMVRSQNGRVGLSQTAAAAAIGVSDSAWQKWFKQQKRDVPIRVLIDLCHVWGVRLSDFMASVEAEQARISSQHGSDATTRELESGLSPNSRRSYDQARGSVGWSALDPEFRREAGEGEADPSQRTRADVDDGITRTAEPHRRSA